MQKGFPGGKPFLYISRPIGENHGKAGYIGTLPGNAANNIQGMFPVLSEKVYF